MKFRKFANWCNERASDGKWDLQMAIHGLSIVENIYSGPLYKRRKLWKKYEAEAIKIIEKYNKIMEGQNDNI